MADSPATSSSEPRPERIRDLIEVRDQPTVVRLGDVDTPAPEWLTESFVVTPELAQHVHALERVIGRGEGCGVFVIGQYGAGKSHLLAWLSLRLERGQIAERAPHTVRVSLVDYAAEHSLESIVAAAVGADTSEADRRAAWGAVADRYPGGLALVVDELSEFLRSKPNAAAFTEDVRFLQFLGEWAQGRPAWIVAAMQEGIEHTGELDYSLYRKIKDRYPLRLLLTPAHVTRLIADGILIKHDGYQAAVNTLCQRLRDALPQAPVDFATLAEIYPIHPATLSLLEEVRDRFSQTRGVVDFVVARLAGRSARGVEPLLDRPWGELLTPEVIVDHFRDLFELAPEFQPLAQQLLPWYDQHMDELFDKPRLAELAWRVLKLLVLVHLSPARERLTVDDAAAWLLVGVARSEPERNRRIVQRVLATLSERGRYVVGNDDGYALALERDDQAALERALERELDAVVRLEPAVALASLADGLGERRLNPRSLASEQWQHRRLSWHFHERRYAVYVGDGTPGEVDAEIALCLRLPWGGGETAPGCYTVVPRAIELDDDLRELAALVRLRGQPLEAELGRQIARRIERHAERFDRALETAFAEAAVIGPDGKREAAARLERGMDLEVWLQVQAMRALRRRYPGFERYAPAHGPLPGEAWVALMREAEDGDLGSAEAGDWVKLIREAYWVPMGLLRRKGRDYVLPGNLPRHELVAQVTKLAAQYPSPRAVHEHLAQPIYGLVPDQVDLLLVFLLLQGEIDIVKGRGSYREQFETLPRPRQYDRIEPGHALSADQIKALERLARDFGLTLPRQWTVLAQRRTAEALREAGRRHTEPLERLAARLDGEEEDLAERLRAHCRLWQALDKGGDRLEGLRQLLYEMHSTEAVLDEARALAALPQRIERLLAERRRLTHLIGQLQPSEGPLARLDEPPGLTDPDALERWLANARDAYAAYCDDYARRHERYWAGLAQHPLYSWQVPPVARARHLGLNEEIRRLEETRRQAQRMVCAGLDNLEFQPRCRCGFDGSGAPVDEVLERFNAERGRLEEDIRCFFRQDDVRERLRRRAQEGVELDAATRAFLDGEQVYPGEAPPEAMDEYLSGEPLVQELDVTALASGLDERPREPQELANALAERLGRYETARLRLRADTEATTRGSDLEAMLDWAAEALGRYGLALPETLSQRAREHVGSALRAEALGEAALLSLDGLGLSDAAVQRIVGWMIDGSVVVPERARGHPGAGLAAAVAELQQPSRPSDPDELGRLAGCLYRAHGRLSSAAGDAWRERLEALAQGSIEQGSNEAPRLVERLGQESEAQWLMVDCLGVALLERLEPVLIESLGAWRLSERGFALVDAPTDTDNAYRALVEADLRHGFAKIDGVDKVIHDADADFTALERRAAAELELGLRAKRNELDPAQPLIVFADHGFRLRADGRGYTHGGASTLERLVPVYRFDPRTP